MKFLLLLVLQSALFSSVTADITVENDLIKPEEIYDLVYSADSKVWWRSQNATRYYCVFRNLWTKERHPKEYPKAARWSNIAMYSGTKEFRPWLKNRATTLGVEKIAETGFTDTFEAEFRQAGKIAHDLQQGDMFYIDQEHPEVNYVYIPPVDINFDFPFLNAIGGMSPSPDWYTGFYLFDTIDEYDRTFWDEFIIRTYPWDAGTDAGEDYTSEDRDMDPPEDVFRMFPGKAPKSGAYLSPDGTEILPVGEFQCVLHTCPVYDSQCLKPNWPPANYCDVLKYPKCATYCNPKTDDPCEACKGNGYEPKTVYHHDCCAAGKEPRKGQSCAEQETLEKDSAAVSRTLALSCAASLAGILFTLLQ